ncbi:MAG: hypothetical protein Q8916_04885 [Bacteroidota bacterium]|nr:hypothetical protein [Bacteroidota bacterium]MDP4229723.1 hypothetical protein [Bacteroidota bacterium]MDP4235778.1 hypothetical protein [Bacteroidota bacterium]
MKKISPLVLMLVFPLVLQAQPKLSGQWSLEFDLGYSIPGSSGMNGRSAQFQQDIQKDYTNKSYPFGDSRAFNTVGSAILAYRFPSTPWSVYGAEYGFGSFVDNGFKRNTILSENAELFTSASALGAEYCLGEPSERLNAFGYLGIALSYITGDVNYFGNHVEIIPSFRGGVDLGIGGRWNWSFAPLALELTLSYFNANLIGKSYEAPAAEPPNQILERALNDGKNPNDSNDASRSISYLSLRLGGRIWF